MSHKPYKKSEWKLATVDQQARVCVPQEAEAPQGSYRKVTILFPGSPLVRVGLDKTPESIGLARSYEWPDAPVGEVVPIKLLPDQFLSLVASSGYARLSVLIEYLYGD